MKHEIIIVLAEGFEEIEAIAPIDFLRRADFSVVTAGLTSKTVKSSHNVTIFADIDFSEITEIPEAIILPGGMPGSINLKNSKELIKLIKKTYDSGKLVSSICAAAIVLNEAGILENKNVTAYPTVKHELDKSNFTGNRVEQDGNIITAKGPGVSLEFAKQIAIYLGKQEKAEELAKAMFM